MISLFLFILLGGNYVNTFNDVYFAWRQYEDSIRFK